MVTGALLERGLPEKEEEVRHAMNVAFHLVFTMADQLPKMTRRKRLMAMAK